MDNRTNLFLGIDGSNILRTVYEANPAPDSEAKADSAIKSALSSFRTILQEHDPTHVLAAFDMCSPNWRHEIYPEYKIHRPPMPMVLQSKLPIFFESLKKIGIHAVQSKGFEGEDILATAFHRWRYADGGTGKGECILISNDKDLIILVAEGARLRDHFRGVWKDEAYVQEKFQISASQFSDYLSLIGDGTDNVPGVRSIGKKTASKLLQKYGTLNTILLNAAEIAGAKGGILVEDRERAILSHRLVTLSRIAPLGVTWNMLRCAHDLTSLNESTPLKNTEIDETILRKLPRQQIRR